MYIDPSDDEMNAPRSDGGGSASASSTGMDEYEWPAITMRAPDHGCAAVQASSPCTSLRSTGPPYWGQPSLPPKPRRSA